MIVGWRHDCFAKIAESWDSYVHNGRGIHSCFRQWLRHWMTGVNGCWWVHLMVDVGLDEV
jgi:hypothetical protein